MESKRTIGIIVLIVGIIILAVSLLADPLGIGASQQFGYRQIAGTVVGAVAIIVGLVLVLRE